MNTYKKSIDGFNRYLWLVCCQQSETTRFTYAVPGHRGKKQPYCFTKFYEYQAALQKVPQVGGLPDPLLNVGVFIQPMELVDGKEVADLRLMQMFPGLER